MKRSIVKDIVNTFVSIAKGMKVTLVNWSVLRPSVTQQYPEEVRELPERYRGFPTLPIDRATGQTRCIACGACQRVCPEHIIKVEAVKGADPKDRKPAVFELNISRCMWCGLCMEVCPKNCLKPARTFDVSCYSRENMIYNLEQLTELGGFFPEEPKTEAQEPAKNDDAANEGGADA